MTRPNHQEQPRVTVLGAALRDARLAAHFGLRELARKIGTNPAFLSNWELGERTPSLENVAIILGALGVTGAARSHILDLARTTEPGITILGNQCHPDHLAALQACEASAKAMTDWHPTLVPDLLQVPAYTVAALTAQGLGDSDIDRLVTTRAERGNLIVGPFAKPITAFLGEAALTNPVASPRVMSIQLRFLNDLAATARRITVRVVPAHTGWHGGLFGPFTVYTMGQPVVYLAHQGAGTFVPDRGDYTRVINQLHDKALTPAESAETIEHFATQFDSAVTAPDPRQPALGSSR
ncbi:helix-turn-helix domain-containing protein [Amycolatopsis jejuensis]|uniref:helix-turn-helix domain-containing protein n=1 Tax=Amycolatopsis jejuensis TaxID=330084 RepID=UPI00068A0CA2|nr:helix-turn-helix transcriptional regulator [Amycolatopsis jejuensis]